MKNILKTSLALMFLLPVMVHASTFQVNQGGTGATTLTGCLQGNGTSSITGTGSACGSGSGSGSSTPLVASTELWVDGNRTDTYPAGTATGTIQYPFKTISAAATYINASSTITTTSLHIAPLISGGGYAEQSLSFNKNITIAGNNATILMLSGPNVGDGSLTFNNDFDCYSCTIFGDVVGNDTSLQNPHSFENSLIVGNLTLYGLAIYTNGTVQDRNTNIYPFLHTMSSSTFTIASSSLVDFTGGDLQVVTINNGSLQFDNAGDNVATNTAYAIVSTSTNSSLGINGFTLVNLGTGGGVNTFNPNKNTPPDTISSMKFVGGVGSNPPLSAGTSTVFLANYTASDVTGKSLYASSTAYLPLNTLGIEVDGNGTYGSNHGLASAGISSFVGQLVASTTISTQLGYDPVNDGLIFLGQFQEGKGTIINDYSPSAQIGTASGGFSWGTGIIGNAGVFAGSSTASKVLFPNINGFSVPTGNANRTFAVWIKKTDSALQFALDSGNNSSGGNRFGIGVNNKMYFSGFGADCGSIPSDPVLNDGNWHMIAATWDGTTLRKYADGIAISSCGLSLNTAASQIYVGVDVLGNNEYWNGSIQGARIYNRTLTANDIAALYSRSSSGSVVPVVQGGTGTTTALGASSVVGILQLSPAGGGAPDFSKAPSYQGQVEVGYFGNGTANLYFNPNTTGSSSFNAFAFPTGISSIGQDGQMPGGANNISTVNWIFNGANGGYWATGDAGLIEINKSANPNQSGASQCVAAMQNASANGSSTIVDLVGNCLLSVPPNRNAGLDPAAGGWELNRHTNITDGFVIGSPGGANNITLDTGNYPYFNGDFINGLSGFGAWNKYVYLPTQSAWTVTVTGVSTTPTGTYQTNQNIYTIDTTNLTGSAPNKTGTMLITGTSTPPTSGTLSKMVNDTDGNGVPTPGDSSVAYGTTTLTSTWNWALVTNLENGAVSVGSSSSSGLFSVFGSATTSTSTISNSNTLATFVGNVPNYAQVAIGNTATGSLASADLVLFNDKGGASTTNYYADVGIANTGANDTTYPAIQANDGYFYSTDGGIDIGSATTSASSTVRFYTGGLSTTTERARFTNTGKFLIGTTTNPTNASLVVQGNALFNGNVNVLAQATISYLVSTLCGGGYVLDLSGNLNICSGKQLVDSNGATGTDSQVLTKSGGLPVWANAGAGSNFFGNSGANTTMTTGSILNVATLVATSSIGIATTTPPANSLVIQAATTTTSTTAVISVVGTSTVFQVLQNGAVTLGTSTSPDFFINIDGLNSTTTGGIKMTLGNNNTGPVLNATNRSGTNIALLGASGALTIGSAMSATVYRAQNAGTPAAPALNFGAGPSGLYFCGASSLSVCMSVSSATSTAFTSTGVGIGSSTPQSKLAVQGTSGSTTPLLTLASSSNATLFSVSSNGTTTVGVLGSHFGSGASTAIPCVYDNTGAIGYITITSLLASGSCLAP